MHVKKLTSLKFPSIARPILAIARKHLVSSPLPASIALHLSLRKTGEVHVVRTANRLHFEVHQDISRMLIVTFFSLLLESRLFFCIYMTMCGVRCLRSAHVAASLGCGAGDGRVRVKGGKGK